jgi:hypothetical protein
MKKIFYFLMTLSLLMSISVTVKASPSSQAWVPDTNALYVPGEVVVGFVEGGTSLEYFAQASALAHEFQAQVVKSFDRFALLQFPEETNVLEMANHLRNQPGVAFAEPNYLRWIPEAEIATTGSNDNPSVTEVELRIVTTEGVTKQLESRFRICAQCARCDRECMFRLTRTTPDCTTSGDGRQLERTLSGPIRPPTL